MDNIFIEWNLMKQHRFDREPQRLKPYTYLYTWYVIHFLYHDFLSCI